MGRKWCNFELVEFCEGNWELLLLEMEILFSQEEKEETTYGILNYVPSSNLGTLGCEI
jgi:hypothetical protein